MLLMLLCIFPIALQAQDDENTYNFKVVDGSRVIWQKVYESDMTIDEIFSRCMVSGYFANVRGVEQGIYLDLKPFDIDFKSAGLDAMTTYIFVSRNHFTANAIIQVRDGRYRVTVEHFVLEQKFSDPFSKQGETCGIEDYALNRKGMFKSSFLVYEAAYPIDFTLDRIFQFTKENDYLDDF